MGRRRGDGGEQSEEDSGVLANHFGRWLLWTMSKESESDLRRQAPGAKPPLFIAMVFWR